MWSIFSVDGSSLATALAPKPEVEIWRRKGGFVEIEEFYDAL